MSEKTLTMVACMSPNRVIGRNGAMPWGKILDADNFLQKTENKPVIMGRKTYEEIGRPLGRGRINVVMSRTKKIKGCFTFKNVVDAVIFSHFFCDEAVIIGGQSIYEQFIHDAHKIYLTVLKEEYEGDAFFPRLNEDEWRLTETKINNEKFEIRTYLKI